ncbi:MAG: type II toxin-antitoxin system VapC family toxin [Prosthecobacter sp.]
MSFTDASFLVSLCSRDVHSGKAREWWFGCYAIMRTSRLALFEAENSVRVMRLSRSITLEDEFDALEMMKRMLLEGFIELWEVPVKRLYPAARRLSQFHTQTAGYGAMDIIHVASAQDMEATIFLSFDRRQRELAEAEGMKVQPM